MTGKHIPKTQRDLSRSTGIQEEIEILKKEITRISSMIDGFAAKIRIRFENEIIEEQELAVLYKKLQREKKLKRRAQRNKQKGNKPGIVKTSPLNIGRNDVEDGSQLEDKKELKHLYREAMLQVHPDKYAAEEEMEDLATDLTATLIDIYESEDLSKLKQYHAHIFSGNAMIPITDVEKKRASIIRSTEFLESEKRDLQMQLTELLSDQLYVVLTTYVDPMSFMNEIHAYFQDRLMKLRKRTRKAR